MLFNKLRQSQVVSFKFGNFFTLNVLSQILLNLIKRYLPKEVSLEFSLVQSRTTADHFLGKDQHRKEKQPSSRLYSHHWTMWEGNQEELTLHIVWIAGNWTVKVQVQCTFTVWELPVLFEWPFSMGIDSQSAMSSLLFVLLVKTITKFSNVIDYHQPDLSSNRTV